MLVRHRSHVDQQPGVLLTQLHLGGIERAEQEIPENMVGGKRAQPARISAGVLRDRLLPCPALLGAAVPEGRRRSLVLPYRRDMPARKRPTPEDTVIARQTVLDGFAGDADIVELLSELAPLHPRDNTFPGEVFLHVAADALDWCGASRADPLPLEGLRERFLAERTFRGQQNSKLQYAVLAAAALHGGTEPDLLDEVAWWQTDDFWRYALFAAVACIRAAARRAGVPVRQACQDLAGRPGHPAP
jgi:hypothetical protein